jgi:EthD domain
VFKVFVYLSKRQDITSDAFIDYYENHHVPLVLLVRGAYLKRALFPVLATLLDDDPAAGLCGEASVRHLHGWDPVAR